MSNEPKSSNVFRTYRSGALTSNDDLVDRLRGKQKEHFSLCVCVYAKSDTKLTMNKSLTKKPMKPITMKPTAVFPQTFRYSA